MVRRVHFQNLQVGSLTLEPAEAHHVRDVLRLTEGDPLELFDNAGQTAAAVIKHSTSFNVTVEINQVLPAPIRSAMRIIIASAIPKADRADWMVEKLTELGIARFVPLITARSVVTPAGKNKFERWERIAIEAAKQSRRSGVMEIAPIVPLKNALAEIKNGWFLSTEKSAVPARDVMCPPVGGELTLLIGPEGGWTADEISQMKMQGLIAVSLTSTILRVETAAVAAAALVACLMEIHSLPSSG